MVAAIERPVMPMCGRREERGGSAPRTLTTMASMEHVEVELYGGQDNVAAVRLPRQRFPGLLIQGLGSRCVSVDPGSQYDRFYDGTSFHCHAQHQRT
ncbi:DUF6959 family protein [Actinophytocola sp.]|uniref:DUF6959 family protein n=1 Tax=Actinophytocola sp. TaxID=1872138 RepID=UPI0039C86F0A